MVKIQAWKGRAQRKKRHTVEMSQFHTNRTERWYTIRARIALFDDSKFSNSSHNLNSSNMLIGTFGTI